MAIAGCVMQWVPLCQEAQETKSFHGGIANIIVNTQFNKGIEPNLACFILYFNLKYVHLSQMTKNLVYRHQTSPESGK